MTRFGQRAERRRLGKTDVAASTLEAVGNTPLARLRRGMEEGIFAGTSTGLNVVGALRLAQELGSGRTVATVACDSGLKYLQGDLFDA